MKEIYERRSIRSYTGAKVPAEGMLKLCKAAMNAANGMATQPWQIFVISDKELIDELVRYNPGWIPLSKAGQGLLLCGDTDKNPNTGYLNIDLAASTQNVLLCAQSLGIGTCWLGVAPWEDRVEAVKRLFRLPGNFHPVSMVACGYAADTGIAPNNRFLEERIHYNAYTE
ncbi:MAG: nitroreductase family protein [Eubacteriaceae bacterium]|nr:nitroreductase family protein [Eubacteriaceae bacterium]